MSLVNVHETIQKESTQYSTARYFKLLNRNWEKLSLFISVDKNINTKLKYAAVYEFAVSNKYFFLFRIKSLGYLDFVLNEELCVPSVTY